MCLTCDIVKRKTVPPGGMLWRDDLVIAHQCLDVAIPGYFIVSPIRHVEEYSDLNDLEISRLSLVTKAIVRIVKELNDIPVSLIQVDTLQKAKQLPCVFNNWGVFYKGHFETVNLLDIAYLQRILKK